jgi:hypothetical protein
MLIGKKLRSQKDCGKTDAFAQPSQTSLFQTSRWDDTKPHRASQAFPWPAASTFNFILTKHRNGKFVQSRRSCHCTEDRHQGPWRSADTPTPTGRPASASSSRGWVGGNLPQRGDDYANFTYPRGPVQCLWKLISPLREILFGTQIARAACLSPWPTDR